jgi:hypothetical protein
LFAVDAAIGFRKTKHFPYELSQEFGAKAAPGKALPVPIGDEAKAAAAKGLGPREAFGSQLRVARIGGKAYLVRNMVLTSANLGKTNYFQYVLVKSIKARMRFREVTRKNTARISNAILAGFNAGWKEIQFT